MNPDLKSLLDSLRRAHPRTKLVMFVSAAAIVAVLAVAGLVSGQPNFVLMYSGLDDTARVGVEKALATGSVRYKVSQPPGPYAVYVDEPRLYEAQNLVALSGALQSMPRGIDSGVTGASTIFLSSAERAQSMQKREWQEMERQLETLDFVAGANVTSSMPDPSPLREKKPPTVSVTLALKNLTEISDEQADNVAKLVRFRFGVPPENVVISDQSGRTLYDPTQADALGSDPEKILAQSARFDRELADKVNRQLALAYGDRKALVTIASDWDHDQRTSLSETLSPKGVLVSEKNQKTETPQGSAPASGAGGPAGTASNIAADTGFGVDNAATPGEGARPIEASSAVATTSDVDKRYETGRSKVETVHTVPTLTRLSVSLLLDESLAPKKDEIAGLVKAAVGFDVDRSDVIQVGTTTFAAEPEPAPGDAQPAPEGGGTSPMLEMVLRRGVEIVAAIGFLFVLFKALKGARPARAGAGAGASIVDSEEAGDAEPDPELLARARIEELVRTDPRRVGEILSRWASDDRSMARAGK